MSRTPGSLEVAVSAPDRVRGLVVEMPVLHNALEAGLIAFAPLMFAARAGAVLGRDRPGHPRPAPAAGGRRRPRHLLRPGRRARCNGGRIDVPALVVGLPADPIHPAADAAMLAEKLPRAEFVRASSIVEWRARPERLTRAAVDFTLGCWEMRLPEKGAAETPRRRSRRA